MPGYRQAATERSSAYSSRSSIILFRTQILSDDRMSDINMLNHIGRASPSDPAKSATKDEKKCDSKSHSIKYSQ